MSFGQIFAPGYNLETSTLAAESPVGRNQSCLIFRDLRTYYCVLCSERLECLAVWDRLVYDAHFFLSGV